MSVYIAPFILGCNAKKKLAVIVQNMFAQSPPPSPAFLFLQFSLFVGGGAGQIPQVAQDSLLASL